MNNSGLVILFFPIAISDIYGTRVHKFAISSPVLFILIACVVGIYARVDAKTRINVCWFLILGIALSFYWLLREEAPLFTPLIIGVMMVIFCRLVFLYKWKFIDVVKSISAFLIPIVCVVSYVLIIKCINYVNYGLFEVSDRTGSAFYDSISLISDVYDANNEDETVWVSYEMINECINSSPSLKSIEPYICERWSQWSTNSGRNDGELSGDDYIWVLRLAAQDSGLYIDAKETELYWKSVKDELKNAYKNVELVRKTGVKLSGVLPRLDYSDLLRYGNYAGKCLWDINAYSINSSIKYMNQKNEETFIAEKVTNTKYLYEEDEYKNDNAFYQKVCDINNLLAVPYNKLGKKMYILNWILVLICVCFAYISRNYESVERVIVVIGLNLCFYIQVFGITLFATPWAAMNGPAYYAQILMPYALSTEIVVVCFVYGNFKKLVARGQNKKIK
ncbi:MAG: hypothetical protein E7302_14180 [Butyrivibrio sp.]|nr:hypothetical protein [Butyrivibrio sp.]